MRYVIHVLILACSLIAGGAALTSALNGESGWYGVIIAGIVFGFAAANLTLLEIRNWVRATGHRQHSRLLRMLAAPVAHLTDAGQDEDLLPRAAVENRLTSGERHTPLPSEVKLDE
jgi:hypothetical protein